MPIMISPQSYMIYYTAPSLPIEMKVMKRTIKTKDYQVKLYKMNEVKLITEYFAQ